MVGDVDERGEKLKALANDIMKQCQKQGLTRREVQNLLIMIDARSREETIKKYDRDVIRRIDKKVREAMEEMKREGKETITIQVVKSTEPYKSALADER